MKCIVTRDELLIRLCREDPNVIHSGKVTIRRNLVHWELNGVIPLREAMNNVNNECNKKYLTSLDQEFLVTYLFEKEIRISNAGTLGCIDISFANSNSIHPTLRKFLTYEPLLRKEVFHIPTWYSGDALTETNRSIKPLLNKLL
ncbi:hypothetical protein HS7_04880 [Sulfolobales archaeon HS-7]|nr:hypothetical protein HS7_04880 [Sulfolobales archaeon HS-7]